MRAYFSVFTLLLTVSLAGAQQAGPPPEAIEERWGIQVVALRLSAADHLLDFRYKVLDADKAKSLHVRQTKPYLEADGKRFTVFNSPRVGPLRSSNPPVVGTVYGMMFVNSYKSLKTGDKVSVVIGDFRADDLTVE